MHTYEQMSKSCGPIASPRHYDWCLVRRGRDILAVFDSYETVRWKPTGEIIVTIPAELRRYFRRTVWGRRLTYYTGVAIINRKKNLSQGIQFLFQFNKQLYWATSQIVIDSSTKKVIAYDAAPNRTIDRGKANRVSADALKTLKAAVVAGLLMPHKPDWQTAYKINDPTVLAKMVRKKDIAQIAESIAARYLNYPPATPQDLLKRIRYDLFTTAGVAREV